MPLKARAYILLTWGVGGGFIAWQMGRIAWRDPWVLAILAAVTSVVQSLNVVGATDRSSYSVGLVGYAFAFVLWGPPEATLVFLAACLAEWLWHRQAWYIQTFNIAALGISVTLAGTARNVVIGDVPVQEPLGIAGILLAGFVFSVVNHLLVGAVIYLARGETFAESGVFRKLTLIIDATLLGLGATAALIWTLSPLASLLAIVPLYLMYSTLRIPALERQAVTDPKTGLYNARYFNETLQRELDRADRYDRPLSVVVGDLDLLRNINNTYGHLAGDTVLSGVASILTRSVREYDIVARVGGEEFAVLMGETTLAEAECHVEAIRESIERATFEISTSLTPIRVTMSFGLAEREEHGEQALEILHRADLALYKAKLTGRNRVCLSSDVLEVADVRTVRTAPHQIYAPTRSQVAVGTGPSDAVAAEEETGTAFEDIRGLEPPRRTVRPSDERRRSRMLDAVVGATALIAVGAVAATVRLPVDIDWTGLLAFAVVTLLAESLSIDLYARDSAVSTAVAPFVAGTLMFGPLGAFVLSITTAGAALLKHRSPLSRFLLNAGVHTIAGLACVTLANAGGRLFGQRRLPDQLLVTLAAAALVYVVTTGMVSLMIHLSDDQPIVRVWWERFSWLWPYYGALALVSFAFIFAYANTGLAGIAVVLVPLMTLRFSQAQYLARTRSVVQKLRDSNIELEERTREVSLLSEELLVVLSNVVDLRDPYVLGHSQHVALYATLIAQELGLSEERITLLKDAGLLHDVGKLGVPESILSKHVGLSDDEYESVKRHVALGTEIIGRSRSLQRLVPAVRHHHERYDGLGYPDGLRGRRIPLEARILSVADAIEAMSSDRPYREGLTADEVLEEIRRHAGEQFDPAVVEAFCRIVEREGPDVIANSAHVVRAKALTGAQHARLQHLRHELQMLAIDTSEPSGG